MKLMEKLVEIWKGVDYPFLIHKSKELRFSEISNQYPIDLSGVRKGDVVAIIGDFNSDTILKLIRLVDIGAIIVPLTIETSSEHHYFFEAALVDVVIDEVSVKRRVHFLKNELIDNLRSLGHAGLVLFSTGSTGRPKAILHDLSLFLKRFETPRPALRTISFLLFDHIGGINTLFHTLFNKGSSCAGISYRGFSS